MTTKNISIGPDLFYEIVPSGFDSDAVSCYSSDSDDYQMTLPSCPCNGIMSQKSEHAHVPLRSPPEKRHVSSARETLVLQSRGIEQIRDFLNDQQQSTVLGHPKSQRCEPSVYGFNHHYRFINLWGATCRKVHQLNGTRIFPSGNVASNQGMDGRVALGALPMSTIFKLPRTRKHPHTSPSPLRDAIVTNLSGPSLIPSQLALRNLPLMS